MATGLNTGCSFRGARLESQPGGSQPSGTLAPDDPTPSSGFHRYQAPKWYTDTDQTKQPYT